MVRIPSQPHRGTLGVLPDKHHSHQMYNIIAILKTMYSVSSLCLEDGRKGGVSRRAVPGLSLHPSQ